MPVRTEKLEEDFHEGDSESDLPIEFILVLGLADRDPDGGAIARVSDTGDLAEGIEKGWSQAVAAVPAARRPSRWEASYGPRSEVVLLVRATDRQS